MVDMIKIKVYFDPCATPGLHPNTRLSLPSSFTSILHPVQATKVHEWGR